MNRKILIFLVLFGLAVTATNLALIFKKNNGDSAKTAALPNQSVIVKKVEKENEIEADNIANATIVDIAAGTRGSFALDNTGTVWVAGKHAASTDEGRPVFVKITGIPKIKKIAVGNQYVSDGHVMLIDENGEVWAFGKNGEGQLGLGDTEDRKHYVKVPHLKNIVAVTLSSSSATSYAIALDAQGEIWGAGSADYGMLGLGKEAAASSRKYTTFTKIPEMRDIQQIAADGSHSLLLDRTGQVWGSGRNVGFEEGAFGITIGDIKNPTHFIKIPNFNNITAIAAGGGASYLVDQAGKLWVSGGNGTGQLGLPAESKTILRFTNPSNMPNIKSIVANSVSAVALDTEGRLWSTGVNWSGALALGEKAIFRNQHFSFTKVPNTHQFVKIALSDFHLMAIDARGKLWVSGKNDNGQLGLGDFSIRLRLTEVKADALAIENSPEGSALYYAQKARKLNALASNKDNKEEASKAINQIVALMDKAIELDPYLLEAYKTRTNYGTKSEGNFYACALEELGDGSETDGIRTDEELARVANALGGKSVQNMDQLANAAKSAGSAQFKIDQECLQLKPKIHTFIGQKLANLKRYDEAIFHYNTALSAAGANKTDIYKERAWAYYEIGKYAESSRDARMACDKNKENCAFLYGLRQQGKLVDDAALKANAYVEAGKKLFEQQDHKAAILQYSKALETDPSHAEAFYFRGAAYAQLNEHQKATDDFFSTLTINPNMLNAFYQRARSFYSLKKYDRATSQLNQFLEKNPDNAASGYNLRGWISFEQKRYQSAIDDAAEAIKRNPKEPAFYDTRGQAYFALGKLPEASKDAEKACDLGECALRDLLKKEGKLTR